MFFLRCNTDNDFRIRFVDHPIETLQQNGIRVDPKAAEEIIHSLGTLKTRFEKDIYLVPLGWENHPWELMKDGWGIVIKGSDRGAIP